MPVKTPKKVTLDDLLKSQEEAWKAIRENQQALKEMRENIFGSNKARDEAWAAIRETQEAHKETEKAIRETREAIRETHDNIFGLNKARDEAWKAIRETQKNVGGLNNSLGSIVERLLIPDLPKKFKKFGYKFNRIASYCYAAGVYAQIDGMLENGEQAIAVEVKTKLRVSDIDDHLVRMEKIQKYAYENGDKRQFMGAMAAFITDESTKNYALNKGLFDIDPSGEDVKVTKPEGEVKVW
jgi:tetratricopeptide (TPR) repeat protein